MNTNDYNDGKVQSVIVPDCNFTTTLEQSDGSYSIKVYLTIKYTVKSDGTYLLTNVSGNWVKSDSNMKVLEAILRYGCSTLYITQNDTKTVSNNFSYDTGFNSYVPSAMATVGANLTLKLQYRTSTPVNTVFTNNILES